MAKKVARETDAAPPAAQAQDAGQFLAVLPPGHYVSTLREVVNTAEIYAREELAKLARDRGEPAPPPVVPIIRTTHRVHNAEDLRRQREAREALQARTRLLVEQREAERAKRRKGTPMATAAAAAAREVENLEARAELQRLRERPMTISAIARLKGYSRARVKRILGE